MDDGGFVPPGGPVGHGEPLPWEIGEVFKISWEMIKRQPILVVVVFGVYIITNIPGMITNFVSMSGVVKPGTPEFIGVTFGGSLLAIPLGFFLQIGQLKMFVAAARGEDVDLGQFFSGVDRFLPLLGFYLLMVLGLMLGLVACVIPFFVLALGWWLGPYYLIDGRLGPIESLRTSWRVSKASLLQLFLFGLASFGLMLVGLCAVCVGFFLAMALTMGGLAVIYLRTRGEMVVVGQAPAPAAAHYGAPPGY